MDHCGAVEDGCFYFVEGRCNCSCCRSPETKIKIHKLLIFASHSKRLTLMVPAEDMEQASLKVERMLQALLDAGGAAFVKKIQSRATELDRVESFINENKSVLVSRLILTRLNDLWKKLYLRYV